MHRASFTVLLAGALAACTKPNPLFLDTAGGVSEGGSQVDTGVSSAGSETSATPTTGTSEPPPPTTTEVVTGSGSEPVTSSGSESTTEPVCDGTEDLVYVNEGPINLTYDAFVYYEPPAGPTGCTLEPEDAVCTKRNWGAEPKFLLGYGVDPMSVRSYMALRFEPSALISAEELADIDIVEVTIELSFYFKAMPPGGVVEFDVYPFLDGGPETVWLEGSGYGEAGEDADGGATFDCSRSSPECTPWGALQGALDGPAAGTAWLDNDQNTGPIGQFVVVPQQNMHTTLLMQPLGDIDPRREALLGDRDPSEPSIGPGVLLVPRGDVPFGVIGVEASESNVVELRPKLIITRKVCE